MLKLTALSLFVALAASLSAETTIVPIRGDLVYGADGSYWSDVLVTNTSSAPITVRRGEVYPVALSGPCGDPTPVIIQPLETAGVLTKCLGLYAYTLESDGPLRVDAVVTTSRPVRLPEGGNSSTIHYQRVETAREWLPSHRQALIPGGIIGGERSRINLFVVNPNDYPINFRLRVTRQSPLAPQRDEEHIVAPRTTAIIVPGRIDDASCELDYVCGHVYRLLFTADGPYYASASSVDSLGDALFASPSVVDESVPDFLRNQ